MTEKFHRELDELEDKMLVLANLAKDMLNDAVLSLKKRDKGLAMEVISKKCRLAELDLAIEENAFRLITLYQPMARDVRHLACILKMITYLTRIGRYGKDIATITIELADEPHVNELISIPHMSKMVISMLNDALKAFCYEDTKYISDFKERDDEIDALRYQIFRECLTYMMENPKYITRCTHYVMMARYLERCADHTCKMAEKIHYMIEGEIIDIDDKTCEVGPNEKLSVLFICSRNSARSQMAEGLMRHMFGDRYDAASAGTDRGKLNPYAVNVMKEIGIDISAQESKSIEGFRDDGFDYVVTVCDRAKEVCPFFPGKQLLHRGFEDPAEAEGTEEEMLEVFRSSRDEIKKWIEETFSE